MLYVGRRRGGEEGNEAVGMGLGFRGMEEEEEEEEEFELEEGEADAGYGSRRRYGGEGEEEEDEFVDPDELTYIDEKLQNVLGHFQKDFEGGVSAENLGAKFGGYGSFLPTYQHSPSIMSQSRSPAMPPNHSSASRSPYNPPVESARQNPFVATNSSVSRSYTSAIDNTRKNNNRGNALNEKDVKPPRQLLNKGVNGSEQKTLKVRIKVGNDNILARNNAAIYSGLGLDISPSSSIGDSPDGSGWASPESRVMLVESPRTILQIMTCFSVPGGILLSPLRGNALEVREKTTPLIEKHKVPVLCKKSAESHRNSSDIAPLARDIKDQMTKKMKSNEKKERSSDLKTSNCIGGSTTGLNKDIEPEVEDLSDAMDSTLLSRDIKTEQHWVEESAKAAGGMLDHSNEIKDGPLKGRISNNSSSKDMMECMTDAAAVNSRNDEKRPKGKSNAKARKVGKALEEHNMDSKKEPPLDLQREYKVKDEAFLDKVKYASDDYKDHSFAAPSHMQKVPSYKATSHERDREKTMQAKDELFEDKQKELGSPINATASMDIMRNNIGAQSSGTLKGKKKNSSSRANQSEKKVKVKPYKEPSSDIIRKSHGDSKSDALEDRSGFTNLPHKDKHKAVKSEKDTVTSRETSKDRRGGRNGDDHKVSGIFVDGPVPMPPACNTVTTESAVAAPASATVLIKEEWVCCDECERWRLLPYGKNPDKFPKKWKCGMLDWLPGMNSCEISEDETTKAVLALYMVPAPENNINSDGRHDIATSGITTATTLPTFERNIQSMTSTGKWKNGPNDGASIPNHLNFEGPKSLKKLQAPVRSRNVDDVDWNHAVHGAFDKDCVEPGYRSSDVTVGKKIPKPKEKRKSLGSSDGGESVAKSNRHPKSKSGLVVDHDDLRRSKKVKKEEFNEPVKHQRSELEVGKNGPSTKATLKNSHKYKGLSPGMEKYDSKVGASSSSKRLHDEDQVFSNGDIKTSDAEGSDQPDFSIKKRKVKQWQLSQCGLEAQTGNHHVLSNPIIAKEALSESESAKEKPMASRSELKVSNRDDHRLDSSQVTHANLTPSRGHITGVDDGGAYAGKAHVNGQCQENIHSQRSLLYEGSMKRDISYAQASTAATSSSSKVSSSHKSKADFQGTRGSPVESVSSSPLKTADKNLLDQHRRYAHGASENVYSQDVDIVNSGHRKSEKTGSSCSQGKYVIKSDVDKAKANVSGGFNGDVNPHGLKDGDMWKDEQDLSAKRDLKEKHSGLGRKAGQSNSGMEQNFGAHGPSTNANNDHKLPSSRQERLPIRFRSDQNEHAKLTPGKDSPQVKSDKEKVDNKGLKIAPSPAKGSKLQPSSNGTANFDASKVAKQSKKAVVPNGVQHNTIKQATLNGDTSSPIHASVILKEARDLKHMSNRLKDVGEDLESASICFEAVLKFLHGASLWEPLNFDSLKQGDGAQAMQLYSQTGYLCGFCAREFERLKKMANAALAYKCVEVAYMKAAFYKHPGSIKDRHALQAAPSIVPPGESPSSSASDVDNLNNQSTLAKAVSVKGVNSPHIASNHIARDNPHLERLLLYAEELNYAFEANRKSQIAISAYIAGDGKDQADGIASLRKVLDFNFHNVKGLLQLIRLSMESISR